MTLVGSMLVWVSPVYVLSVAGLFLAGLGIGVLFPLATAVALALGRGQPRRAAARLVLGVGIAILIAPFMLGLAADLSAIEVAWVVIPIMCIVALVLTIPLGRSDLRA